MKNYYLLFAFLLCGLFASAQQEDQFTQFMHYKLGFNPAYAGATGQTRVTGIGRQQWIGIDGAPQSQLVTFNMAPMTSLGVGASLSRSSIGLTDRYTLEGNYAYRFPFANGYLGLGLSASVRLMQVRFQDAQANQPVESDQAIPGGFQSRYVPNFGAGLYYNNKDFYLGFSAPRLLRSNLDLSDQGGRLSTEEVHFYGMTGFVIPIQDEDIILQPHLLLKYVSGAPFDGDFNLSLTLQKRLTFGASYRLGGNKSNSIGESISALFSAQVSDKIMFGLSYDMGLSDLRDENSGSAEVFLHYFVGGESQDAILENPRFFKDEEPDSFF
jgi:type IX secretion system PorP/SprF family membrane protein